jgi:hypothetical protein
MAIPAGVVRIPFVGALVAPLQMPPKRRCAAALDGTQDTLLPHGQRLAMCLAKLIAMGAHNVRDFQSRPHEKDAPYGWGSMAG